MKRISASVIFYVFVIAAVVLLAHTSSVVSQPTNMQPSLNTVIQDVQKAEVAGANTAEMDGLLTQLNSVVALQNQLQNLSPKDTQRQSELGGQIASELTAIDMTANQTEIAASQRTSRDHILSYTIGVIGALVATVISHYSLLLWRKYRTKRAFQMKIVPK
jgi:hypothetical protein